MSKLFKVCQELSPFRTKKGDKKVTSKSEENIMARWTREPNAKNIYYRNVGGEKTYMLRTTYNGTRKDEGLAGKTLAEVKEIQAILQANAERGTPPFFYRDLQALIQEHAQEKVIKQTKERKALIQEEKKRLNNTVEEFRERIYWPQRLANTTLSAHQNKTIEGRWNNFLKPFFGRIPLEDLQNTHFIEFVRQIRTITKTQKIKKKDKTVEQDTGKHYSETTIQKMVGDMRQIWNTAVDHGIVAGAFPGKSVIKTIVIDNEKKCYLEPAEADLLLQTVYNTRLESKMLHDIYCYVVISLYLGLRAGDIHKLTWQSVDRNIIENTKNKRSRFVSFDLEPVRVMLKERKELYPPHSPTDLIFPSESGTRRHKVPKRYYKIIQELGFNDTPRRKNNAKETIDFHALRHTYATFMAVRGVDQITLMKLMGHEKLDMTLRYIEIADNIRAEASKKILDIMPPLPALNKKVINAIDEKQ